MTAVLHSLLSLLYGIFGDTPDNLHAYSHGSLHEPAVRTLALLENYHSMLKSSLIGCVA